MQVVFPWCVNSLSDETILTSSFLLASHPSATGSWPGTSDMHCTCRTQKFSLLVPGKAGARALVLLQCLQHMHWQTPPGLVQCCSWQFFLSLSVKQEQKKASADGGALYFPVSHSTFKGCNKAWGINVIPGSRLCSSVWKASFTLSHSHGLWSVNAVRWARYTLWNPHHSQEESGQDLSDVDRAGGDWNGLSCRQPTQTHTVKTSNAKHQLSLPLEKQLAFTTEGLNLIRKLQE